VKKQFAMKPTALPASGKKAKPSVKLEVKLKGEIKALMKTAGNMLAKGLPDELIMEITGLTLDEIAKLKAVN
jgi:hypothetical protein